MCMRVACLSQGVGLATQDYTRLYMYMCTHHSDPDVQQGRNSLSNHQKSGQGPQSDKGEWCSER